MLLAVCQEFEMEIDGEMIPRIAFGFAGGIGNTGSVCGAVAGAVMAMSLKIERSDTMDDTLHAFAAVQEFRRRFEAEMETISCRELTGMEMRTKEEIEQFMSSDIPEAVCFPAVGIAYKLVVDLLKESS